MSVQTEQLNTHSLQMHTQTRTHAHPHGGEKSLTYSEWVLMFSLCGVKTLYVTLAAQVSEEKLTWHHLLATSLLTPPFIISFFALYVVLPIYLSDCISLDISQFLVASGFLSK